MGSTRAPQFLLRRGRRSGASVYPRPRRNEPSHVERYFADALSGMESGMPCIQNLAKGKDGCWRTRPGGLARVAFPDNLFVIGTVNVDETTDMFSPKVLDRANTFEFRVRWVDLSMDYRRPSSCKPGEPSLVRGFLEIARDREWHLSIPIRKRVHLSTHLRRLHQPPLAARLRVRPQGVLRGNALRCTTRAGWVWFTGGHPG